MYLYKKKPVLLLTRELRLPIDINSYEKMTLHSKKRFLLEFLNLKQMANVKFGDWHGYQRSKEGLINILQMNVSTCYKSQYECKKANFKTENRGHHISLFGEMIGKLSKQ